MKKPWNITNVPVYSLATYDYNVVNMNICTYVTAVSMQPKRYMVAVYHGTQSLKNLGGSTTAVLQLLSKEHVTLVNTLGKRSGAHYNKSNFLSRKNLLSNWNSYNVLRNCAAVMELEKISVQDAGDHAMFLFNVNRYRTFHNDVLMLDDLRMKKLIRI